LHIGKDLITGGDGCIGSVLAPMLFAKGRKVMICDSLVYGAISLLGFSKNSNLEITKGDVREAVTRAKFIKEYDWILHLAAILGYPACAADPHLPTMTNVEGARNVLKAMGCGQRLAFASTGSTYGEVEGVVTEATQIATLTLYCKSRRDAEEIIRDSNKDHAILRFATVFGSSSRMRIDLLVNDFVYQALRNRQIVLFEGHFRRTFLHSTDGAAVYPLTMENFDRMKNEVFNVGAGTGGDKAHAHIEL
jgi:nucleoside-diphosphate-sugar epimerase